MAIKVPKFNELVSVVLIFLSFSGFACNYAPFKETKPVQPPMLEDKRTAFEKDLDTLKTADFDFIYVFRRKDGGTFDGEDKKYLRANAPMEINRFVSTDDGRAFIAGSKFKFPTENLEILGKRFNVEDYSQVKEEPKKTP